jgi:hypothetical protein
MWRDAAKYLASSHPYLRALLWEAAASLVVLSRELLRRAAILIAAVLITSGISSAQSQPPPSQAALTSATPSADADSYEVKPVPVLSVGMGFITPFEGGTPDLEPLISPVVLIPIGDRWLIESRATFESDLAPPPGSNSFRGVVQKEVDYAQLDYIVNPSVTITVGRYLTPFGIFNERLYPIWIRNLQSDPLILPIATGPSNAGTGATLRGAFAIRPKISLNYATYFSALSTVSPVDSSRFAGFRVGVFLPGPRLEVGGSFQHLLQDERSNSFGFHFAWQPPSTPVDLRAEYARSARGSGYWIESAYRLSQVPMWQRSMRRTQIVGRVQQFFVGELPSNVLPTVSTREVEFGVNYFLLDDLRAVSSFGRQFAFQASENIWTVGLTYRFVLGLGPGEPRGDKN